MCYPLHHCTAFSTCNFKSLLTFQFAWVFQPTRLKLKIHFNICMCTGLNNWLQNYIVHKYKDYKKPTKKNKTRINMPAQSSVYAYRQLYLFNAFFFCFPQEKVKIKKLQGVYFFLPHKVRGTCGIWNQVRTYDFQKKTPLCPSTQNFALSFTYFSVKN